MAYEEELADRIRELVGGQSGLSEQKIFGGLSFLIDGNMAVAASGRGGLMVRVDPMEGEKLVSTSAAQPMEMRGRQMPGWLRVSADDVRTKRWVKLGTAYAAGEAVQADLGHWSRACATATSVRLTWRPSRSAIAGSVRLSIRCFGPLVGR